MSAKLSTRGALLLLAVFWLSLLPLFAVWLALDQEYAPWDMAMHSGFVLRLHDGLLRWNPWRAYELSRFYPPLFHVLAVPASFFSTHPDAYCFGSWVSLLVLLWATFLTGRSLAGTAAGLVAALIVPAYGHVSWMGRMPMTDLTLTATVALTLFLLVRGVKLGQRRQARWLGIAVALGLLAKWPYVLFTFLPFAQLLWRHWRETGRDFRARRFWRPLLEIAAWAAAVAGPWYVRSVPNLLRQAPWHLGSGVIRAEGDPPVLSLASLELYARWLATDDFTLPTWLLLAAGCVALLRAWRRRDTREVAAPARWSPLGLSALGGALCLLLIANKDPRYPMPLMPIVAVVSGAGVTLLGARARTFAVAACAVLSWALVFDNLFRLAPPDPTDWKVEETAAAIAPRIAGVAPPPRILVVPNDPHMNFISLGYALQRIARSKVEVRRIEEPLDEAGLAGFDLAVLVLPPSDETPVSRHSIETSRSLLSRAEWKPVTTFTRGDGREVRILERRSGPDA